MKTIFYTGVFRFPAGDAAAARVLNNAKILKRLGYRVVFLSWGGTSREKDKSYDGNYYYKGFQYLNTNDIDKGGHGLKKINNFIFSGDNALKIINHMKNETDIIIAYDTPLFFTGKIVKLCKRKSIPFIYDITEWSDANEFPGDKYAPPYWINTLNMYLNRGRVKNKIVISSLLNEFYNKSNNIIIPPLVDADEEKWINLKEVLPAFDGIRIVYAGSPGKKDLLEIMVEAFISCLKKEMKLQFVIVGVREQDVTHYKNFTDLSSFKNNIVFCGRVAQTIVPSYYHSSDFSIIIRESTRKNNAGFPTKLAESLMAKCPVILNYTSDISKYISDGYNGIVVNDFSSEELEKKISYISQLGRENINVLKNNAFQTALEKFNYVNYVEAMRDFFEKLK